MSEHGSWFKLYRKLRHRKDILTDKTRAAVYLHCLLNAVSQHDTVFVIWKGARRKLLPGEVFFTVKSFSVEYGLSAQSIRTAMAYLEQDGFFNKQSTNHGSILTICNWDKYQLNKDDVLTTNQQPPNKPITNQQQTNNLCLNFIQPEPLPPNGLTRSDAVLINTRIIDIENNTHTSTCVDPPSSDQGTIKIPKPEKPKIECQIMGTIWNELAVGLPKVSCLSGKRLDHTRARLRENPDLGYWRAVIEKIAKSNFCLGLIENRPWKANYDWFIRRDTHVKVMEGLYNNTESVVDAKKEWRNEQLRLAAEMYAEPKKGLRP